MYALLEKTHSETVPAQTSVAMEGAEPLSRISHTTRRQRVVAAIAGLVAAGTLGVSLQFMPQLSEQTIEPALTPHYEASTTVDESTWYGDLPPGTIDRLAAEELATGPTAEPTDWKTLSTGT